MDDESVGTSLPRDFGLVDDFDHATVLGMDKDLGFDLSSITLDQMSVTSGDILGIVDDLGINFETETSGSEPVDSSKLPPSFQVFNRKTQQFVTIALKPDVHASLFAWLKAREETKGQGLEDLGALAYQATTLKGNEAEILLPAPPGNRYPVCVPESNPRAVSKTAVKNKKRGPYKCGRCCELKGRNHKNVCIFVKEKQAYKKKKPSVKKKSRGKGRPKTYACGCGYYMKKDPKHKTNCPLSKAKWLLRSETREGDEDASSRSPTASASNSLASPVTLDMRA